MVSRILAAASLALPCAVVACSTSNPCGVEACDITQPSCQQIASRAAACLRGEAPVDVPIRVLPRELAADSVSTDPSAAERRRVWQRALALFALAKVEMSEEQVQAERFARVGAYYDPETKVITVIDDGRGLASRPMTAVLVHELVHALQDRSGARDGAGNRTFDAWLAARAITEGEASLIEDRANIAMFGTTESKVSWDAVFERWQAMMRADAMASEIPIEMASIHVPYAFGEPFVRNVERTAGAEAVRDLVRAPPRTTRRILTSSPGRTDEDAAIAAALAGESVPNLGDGYAYFDFDALGAWALEQFLMRTAPDLALSASAALAADAFVVLEGDSSGRIAATWRLRFDDEATAAAVAAAVQGRKSLQAWTLGRDAVILASDDPLALAPAVTFGPRPPANSAATASSARAIDCVTR